MKNSFRVLSLSCIFSFLVAFPLDFEDDEKCLDYFHRFQTIRKLQEVRDIVGHNDFAAVFSNFESVKNSGYTLEEIISTSTDTLIDREEYLQYRMEDEEDDEEEDAVNEDEDENEEVWETVPPEMTGAVLIEQNQVAQAIEASRASAEEDEQIRETMEASRNSTEN